MRRFRTSHSPKEQAAALLIVLAMVVLMTGLTVAYLSRATSDRQIAQSSFHQSKVDELAQSAMDLIIGDLQTEIAKGSSPTPTASVPNSTPTVTPFVYPLTTPANILPVQWPTPIANPSITPVLNLVRVSLRNDSPSPNPSAVPYPGVSSHASNVNSSSDASANLRVVKLSRWNKHYLIPRSTLSPTPSPTDTSIGPNVSFSAPDWVILTRNGPVAFSAWNASLADPTQANTSYCVGRYAYAIYDEAGLLDANVAGFPSSTTPSQYGAKGVSAFADLTALGLTQNDINLIVGWRNYFSAGPSGNFPSFNFNSSAATAYVNTVLSNTNGFMTVPVPTSTPNNMSNTDQQFLTRQDLINLLINSGLSNTDVSAAAYALQYLGTFSRELNAPSWVPMRNATDMGAPNNGTGNIYAYKDNAANPSGTPINPNLLNVRVVNSFTRADGTITAVRSPCDAYHQAINDCGEPLINRRFPLTRLAGLGPTGMVTTNSNGNPLYSTIVNGTSSVATAATIQRDFGLVWNLTSNRWDYAGPSGTTPQTSIETLWQVANESQGREPNFFELLKAAILNGSVGMGSGSGNTFVASEPKYYDNANAGGTSSDYQIMQIGANIINQWDSGNVPIFIGFGNDPSTSQPYEVAGVKNLPYLSKLVFAPYWTSTSQFDAWLVPSLWNPHQNAPPASQNIRVAMPNTTQSMTAVLTESGTPASATSTSVVGGANQYMTVDATNFATSPSGATSATAATGSAITQMPTNAGKYYGFHFTFATPGLSRNNAQTAYPDFGAGGCTFELQVQVGSIWKTYQRWKNSGPNHPLIFQPPTTGSWWNNHGLQDPDFVTLDPRTLRFGVWGNAYKQSLNTADLTAGTQTTLDLSANPSTTPGVFESITALPPQGTMFSPSPSPSPTPTLYLYAGNSDATVHYTDLDLVQRFGDAVTPGNTSPMQPANTSDRPLIFAGAFRNGVFQSVAELGHVYRDQPWKTLSFAIAAPTASPYPTPRSADAGLLDVFTLHESSIDAGKTSLNTRQPLVLKAILGPGATPTAGAVIEHLNDATTAITQAQRDAIVTALTNLTASQPMVNKAELVTRLSNDPSVTGLGNKEARECVVRAFSDAGKTRTWNLLIDLVAQSGRYPPNASTLAGFNVEGEVHYWVHVAIDRFTGHVIDKQIEVVNE